MLKACRAHRARLTTLLRRLQSRLGADQRFSFACIVMWLSLCSVSPCSTGAPIEAGSDPIDFVSAEAARKGAELAARCLAAHSVLETAAAEMIMTTALDLADPELGESGGGAAHARLRALVPRRRSMSMRRRFMSVLFAEFQGYCESEQGAKQPVMLQPPAAVLALGRAQVLLASATLAEADAAERSVAALSAAAEFLGAASRAASARPHRPLRRCRKPQEPAAAAAPAAHRAAGAHGSSRGGGGGMAAAAPASVGDKAAYGAVMCIARWAQITALRAGAERAAAVAERQVAEARAVFAARVVSLTALAEARVQRERGGAGGGGAGAADDDDDDSEEEIDGEDGVAD